MSAGPVSLGEPAGSAPDPPGLDADLSNPDLFGDGPPHGLFERLRAEAPVHFNPLPDEPGFWSLTRATDVAAVSRDTETFSSWLGGTMIRDEAIVPLEIWRQTMINMDPPQHTKFREIVATAFTPRRIAQQEGQIRRLAGELLDDAVERRSFDLVADVAVPLPLGVIAELLGVPAADRPVLFDWNKRIAGFDDSRLRDDPEDGLNAVVEMIEYLGELVAERKGRPRADLISDLIAAEIDGQRLHEFELAGFFSLLMVAGNETTRHTYSGGVLALIDHPDQRRRLLEAPALIPNAVEELLRWVSAVMHFRRTATSDTEIGGVPIAAGDKVVMWYVSANRDEELIDDAGRFDVGRDPDRHQAFGGGGRHFCLGAGLARLELKVLLEETLRRAPELERAGQPKRMRSTLFNALLELPVQVTRQPEEDA